MISPNPRTARREELKLTQVDAAAKAKVSAATYRRWEEDPDKVGKDSRARCERVLAPASAPDRGDAADFEKAWGDGNLLTPRQAVALQVTLDSWADQIGDWVRHASSEPLWNVMCFDNWDRRAFLHIGDNRAWAQMAADRLLRMVKDIQHGTLAFMWEDDCFFDHVAMASAVDYAPNMAEMLDDGGVTDDIAAMDGDSDWDEVEESFDDLALNEWMWLLRHPRLVPVLLAARHPFTWFDTPVQPILEYGGPIMGWPKLPDDRAATAPETTSEN